LLLHRLYYAELGVNAVYYQLVLVFLSLVLLATGVRAESANSASARASLQAECGRQAAKKLVSKQERHAYIKHCMAAVDSQPVDPPFIEPL